MSEIVKLNNIEIDSSIEKLLMYKIKSSYRKIGRFINVNDINKLKKMLLESEYNKVLYLPKMKTILLKTSYIDIGYKDYLPINDAVEYNKLMLLDSKLIIKLIYKHCNIFSYIIEPIELLDKRVTISRDVYVFLNVEKNKIWDIKIGKVCNPNFLYYCKELNNVKIKLKDIKKIKGLNRLEFSEGLFDNSDLLPF